MPDVKYLIYQAESYIGSYNLWFQSSGGAVMDYERALAGAAQGEVWVLRLFMHNHGPMDPVTGAVPLASVSRVAIASNQDEDTSPDAEFSRIL